jgi:hypothetical protein
MTGPEHCLRAEELAAGAHRLLGQADSHATAGVWAAVAQTHAVLALAAATAVGASGADHRCPVTTQIARFKSLACGEESSMSRGYHRRLGGSLQSPRQQG